MVANCSTISSVLFFIDPCCTLQHNILIVFDLLFKNVFSFPCRNPFKTSFFLINDISTHPAWFCWQHQPAVDLVGPEAETQAQEEQSRTSFTPNPRVPGAATQPQRAPQTEPSGELRRPGPGTYHHEHNIRFCRDYIKWLYRCPSCRVCLFSVCVSVVVVLITFPLLHLIQSSLLGFSSEQPGRRPARFPWGGATAWCLRLQVTTHWLRQNTQQQHFDPCEEITVIKQTLQGVKVSYGRWSSAAVNTRDSKMALLYQRGMLHEEMESYLFLFLLPN